MGSDVHFLSDLAPTEFEHLPFCNSLCVAMVAITVNVFAGPAIKNLEVDLKDTLKVLRAELESRTGLSGFRLFFKTSGERGTSEKFLGPGKDDSTLEELGVHAQCALRISPASFQFGRIVQAKRRLELGVTQCAYSLDRVAKDTDATRKDVAEIAKTLRGEEVLRGDEQSDRARLGHLRIQKRVMDNEIKILNENEKFRVSNAKRQCNEAVTETAKRAEGDTTHVVAGMSGDTLDEKEKAWLAQGKLIKKEKAKAKRDAKKVVVGKAKGKQATLDEEAVTGEVASSSAAAPATASS